ncbi:hypothetical protein K402DRAFT_185112 [Aulographum hederae CBS 113979]|uniref:Uncharacterized protein n=1 Tax=Aulographum hederae CBS 113979 TaxID=1176131 RepID=A0A6G1GQ70_9PEZI|nr:hypothetical protein K402DRAFT_185112 [Aulographum hederae CBS 113979]
MGEFASSCPALSLPFPRSAATPNSQAQPGPLFAGSITASTRCHFRSGEKKRHLRPLTARPHPIRGQTPTESYMSFYPNFLHAGSCQSPYLSAAQPFFCCCFWPPLHLLPCTHAETKTRPVNPCCACMLAF